MGADSVQGPTQSQQVEEAAIDCFRLHSLQLVVQFLPGPCVCLLSVDPFANNYLHFLLLRLRVHMDAIVQLVQVLNQHCDHAALKHFGRILDCWLLPLHSQVRSELVGLVVWQTKRFLELNLQVISSDALLRLVIVPKDEVLNAIKFNAFDLARPLEQQEQRLEAVIFNLLRFVHFLLFWQLLFKLRDF